MGFKEIPHTADCEIRVWAGDLSALFSEAARGMNAVCGAEIANGPRLKRTMRLAGPDPESLLVSFLTELVLAQESEAVAFDKFDLQVSDGLLVAHLEGAPLRSLIKPIKAVTYHNLKVRRTAGRYEVELVFDV